MRLPRIITSLHPVKISDFRGRGSIASSKRAVFESKSLPVVVRALGELVDHGHLRALPKRAAGGGYRLVVPDNVDAGRTDSPSRSAV
jgi:hypothetical protein